MASWPDMKRESWFARSGLRDKSSVGSSSLAAAETFPAFRPQLKRSPADKLSEIPALNTFRTSSCKYLVQNHFSTSATLRQPTPRGSLCLAVDSTRTAVLRLFRSLVRRFGTHCQMNSEIRRLIATASDNFFKTILFSFYRCG